MAGKLTLVRTGPSSYLKLNADDAKAWRAANMEYSDPSQSEVIEIDSASEFPAEVGELPPFAEWTVAGLKQQAAEWELTVPSNANKDAVVELVQAEYDRRQQIEAPPIETAESDESDESDG